MKITNIRIQVFLYCILALSGCMIIYTAGKADSNIVSQNINYNNHLRYHIANAFFRQGTDLLTDAVRRFVVTMDPKYMDEYFRESKQGRHRDKALEMVRDLRIDRSLKDTLTNAMKISKGLMHTEYHAMHIITPENRRAMLHRESGGCPLTPEEQNMTVMQRHEQAERLLWDDAYIRNKTQIYACLARGLELARTQAEARHMQLRKELLRMLSLSAVSLVVLVLAICGIFIARRSQHLRMVELQAEKNARMNVRLKAERAKSIKAEKAKSYFFSAVSHDIRTPLNSIIGFAEMLKLGIDDPEERAKALDAIMTSGQTLLALINDVLDLSKLESGKMKLHPEPTDMAALIGKVSDSFEVAASRGSVQLRTEVGKMPYLKLDPQRIRQILFNLIGNAVKFTAKGTITVRASYEDDTFTLSVSDTGRGISPENIGKLMSPYVQLQEHDSSQGTGLGLAICKQLAAQMHGKLSLESTLGKGSVFTLRIPHVKAFTEKESEAYFRAHSAPGEAVRLDESVLGKNILIVDDQKLNRRILQTMLTRIGFRKVLTAGDGREALDMMRSAGNIDLVLTDMTMPVMDGAELVREIRKMPQTAAVPVYVITADVEVQSVYRENGFDGILIKPITIEKLKTFLAKCLSHPAPDTGAKA